MINFAHAYFSTKTNFRNLIRNSIRVSNMLDPGRADILVILKCTVNGGGGGE